MVRHMRVQNGIELGAFGGMLLGLLLGAGCVFGKPPEKAREPVTLTHTRAALVLS